MINKLKTSFLLHQQAFFKAWSIFRLKPYATMVMISLIAAPLSLPLLTWVSMNNVQLWTKSWQEEAHILLYLDAKLFIQQQEELLKKIQQVPLVAQASLTSPEEGLAELANQEGLKAIVDELVVNPLPPVIEVIPSKKANSADALKALYERLITEQGIESGKLDLESFNKWFNLFAMGSMVSNILMSILILVVILMIATSLRLIFFTNHEEIRVLQFVGANDAYILRPFLYLGMIYAVVCGLTAIIFCDLIWFVMGRIIKPYATILQSNFHLSGLSIESSLIFLFILMALSWLCAHISIHRQLGEFR